MNKFRTLTADDIECRVSTVSEKGCSLLLYKDARCDMKILDETVGPENWQRSHELINGNLFCNVSIFDEVKGEWITKQDVGTESYTEKEKGQASDAFKRACFNWGIGRELYTSPYIWIKQADVALKELEYQGKKKYTTYDKFRVTQIIVEDGEIKALAIRNDSLNRMVYQFDVRKKE
ncbi:Rad52/Rad22 family DNA repair protein [Kineothrix sedimenti]|uniref:Rad52/Rad22 family DNA repair protein n=1 Tax=Kineothrix sedimenti TaxID=3123317 RepID=A0ABZ3EV43_9FIRM